MSSRKKKRRTAQSGVTRQQPKRTSVKRRRQTKLENLTKGFYRRVQKQTQLSSIKRHQSKRPPPQVCLFARIHPSLSIAVTNPMTRMQPNNNDQKNHSYRNYAEGPYLCAIATPT